MRLLILTRMGPNVSPQRKLQMAMLLEPGAETGYVYNRNNFNARMNVCDGWIPTRYFAHKLSLILNQQGRLCTCTESRKYFDVS